MRYILPLFLTLSLTFCNSQESESENLVRDYLKSTYPEKANWQENELVFFDTTTITPISDRILTALTGNKFFQTTLITGFYEYPELNVILAINTEKKEVQLLKSPTFELPTSEFLGLFENILVSNEEERKEFAVSISSLFSRITFNGRTGLLETGRTNEQTVELWHGDLSWLVLTFVYTNYNKLTQIKVEPGFKRQSLPKKYRRIDN